MPWCVEDVVNRPSAKLVGLITRQTSFRIPSVVRAVLGVVERADRDRAGVGRFAIDIALALRQCIGRRNVEPVVQPVAEVHVQSEILAAQSVAGVVADLLKVEVLTLDRDLSRCRGSRDLSRSLPTLGRQRQHGVRHGYRTAA